MNQISKVDIACHLATKHWASNSTIWHNTQVRYGRWLHKHLEPNFDLEEVKRADGNAAMATKFRFWYAGTSYMIDFCNLQLNH